VSPVAEIVRWRRKPDTDKKPQVSARYLPPEASLGAFLEIARMADSGAQVHELRWAGAEGELCVRYTNFSGEMGHIDYVHVPAGHWLAYAPDGDFLYVSGEHDWERWYERVEADDA
jgi:hypothetical protein